MKIIFHPIIAFSFFQLFPLFIFVYLDNNLKSKLLQGYQVSQVGLLTIEIYVMVLFSFALGYILSKSIRLKHKKLNFTEVVFIRKVAILATSISIITLVFIIFNNYSFNQILLIIASSTANQFKAIVYGNGTILSMMIMFRHIIFILIITYFISYYTKYKKDSILLILISFFLIPIFLFTSSRLTIISFFIFFILFFLKYNKISYHMVFKLLLIVGAIAFSFGLGIYMRSLGTWQNISGEESGVLTPILYEIGAYLISPINYTVAFIENSTPFIGNKIEFLFPFIFSVFNINSSQDYLNTINSFYNPSLNQIGIVGGLYINYGYLLWIFLLIYGFISGLLYRLFLMGNIVGLYLYPVLFISLFDSMRGYLLMQNILAANILFFLSLHFLYNLKRKY